MVNSLEFRRRPAAVAIGVCAAGVASFAFANDNDAPAPGSIESISSCSASLCIDAPPQGPMGLDGSGGWGYNTKANAPVSSLTVNVPARLTVTALQPASVPLCGTGPGSITITYSSRDFRLAFTSDSGAAATTPFDRGGVAVFSYSGDFWCHGDQSDGFTFTPLNATTTALAFVTATVTAGGQQASETFPIAIKNSKKHY